ncbi:hypothetical protein KBC86_00130 [Candidatus Gracilibacteria bacterium]|nr:hypothetical protein [Candidatus Gracilibacteria bacterium]
MKINIAPYILASTLTTVSPQAIGKTNPNPPPLPLQTATLDYKKLCDIQSDEFLHDLLPQIRLRAGLILARGVRSLELSLAPSKHFPNHYVQTEVLRYLDGEKRETDLGEVEIELPNPFLNFKLEYSLNGEYYLQAQCKYPEKK